jgi:regulatory protein
MASADMLRLGAELEAADQATAAAAAKRHAYVLLSRRDHSTAELTARLADKGFEAGDIEGVVAQLRERGYLDDARFAAHYVSAHARRGQGPQRIRRELEELGVAGELVSEALANGPDWASLAREIRGRRFGAEPPKSWPDKARQGRFLQYRGFSPDHIRSALGAPDPDLDPTP